MMKILVTGANGFIGKNLTAELRNQQYEDIYEYDIHTDPALLDEYCKEADFVFHLAGANRPQEQSEFMEINFGLTSILLETLKRHHNTCPIMVASSIQAALENSYGMSKKACENLLFLYGRETGAKVLVYRFPNVFGKWCRPNYNSVIATFCYNIANDLPIQVNDSDVMMNLVYINDVVDELIHALNGRHHKAGDYCEVPIIHFIRLGKIADLIRSFRESRNTLNVPDMSDGFTKKLYSTYLSYLPQDQLSYPLKMNIDSRGSFTEFIKTEGSGQVSVNIIKPGITKGNHWHHTKSEKFLVVSGKGVIRFREIGSGYVVQYHVRGENLEVVDIPIGYTHNIENIGETDLVTIMWANEQFDPYKPDTFLLEV